MYQKVLESIVVKYVIMGSFFRRVVGRAIIKPLKPTLVRELNEHIQTTLPEIGMDATRYAVVLKKIRHWSPMESDQDNVSVVIDAAQHGWLTTMAQTYSSPSNVLLEFSPFVTLLNSRRRNAMLVHEVVHLSTPPGIQYDKHQQLVCRSICEGFGRYYEERYLEDHKPSVFERAYDVLFKAVAKINEITSRISHALSGREYFDYYAKGCNFITRFPAKIRACVPTITFIHPPTLEELKQPGLYLERPEVKREISIFSNTE
ncbi:MAG: hypothetical protein ABII22_05675 [Candidatus Micrarchaeota archaeon]